MRLLHLIPPNTNHDFFGRRAIAFWVSGLVFAATLISLMTQGLHLGIDFSGGILIEAQASKPVETIQLRERLERLGLGSIELQSFGGPRDVLIRVQQQAGGEAANRAAVAKIRETLGTEFEYRRIESVGPKIGGELMRDGLIATILAILGITLYVAFRFEWQFGVGALVATGHDVISTVGLYSIFQLEFDLTSVAALLTLAGYSVNDTVVVYDRIREMLRRHKSADMPTIINQSVNSTLTRTVMTSLTTLVAIVPLLLFGGSTLFNLTLALTFGIVVGTYSSIFVAANLLVYMKPIRRGKASETGDEGAAAVGSEGR